MKSGAEEQVGGDSAAGSTPARWWGVACGPGPGGHRLQGALLGNQAGTLLKTLLTE